MTPVAPIETRQLTCRFGKHTALAPLDFTIPRGSVYALVGHNGAGKTTLMKLLLNMIRPTSGSASVLGVPSTQLTSSIFTRVGYVAEGQEMPGWMTVRSFMNYLRPFYPTWNEGTLLRDLDLPGDRHIRDLSRGMRMKVALASVLAFQPELILMDEPFSGLDPLVRDELTRALLERLSATVTRSLPCLSRPTTLQRSSLSQRTSPCCKWPHALRGAAGGAAVTVSRRNRHPACGCGAPSNNAQRLAQAGLQRPHHALRPHTVAG